MRIKLTVLERIILLEILDKIQQDVINKKVIREIEDQLSFLDSELIKLDIKLEDKKIVWNYEFGNFKIIFFGRYGYNLMKRYLFAIGDEMNDSHKTLIDKFKNAE